VEFRVLPTVEIISYEQPWSTLHVNLVSYRIFGFSLLIDSTTVASRRWLTATEHQSFGRNNKYVYVKRAGANPSNWGAEPKNMLIRCPKAWNRNSDEGCSKSYLSAQQMSYSELFLREWYPSQAPIGLALYYYTGLQGEVLDMWPPAIHPSKLGSFDYDLPVIALSPSWLLDAIYLHGPVTSPTVHHWQPPKIRSHQLVLSRLLRLFLLQITFLPGGPHTPRLYMHHVDVHHTHS
jgi:hypothetical protein